MSRDEREVSEQEDDEDEETRAASIKYRYRIHPAILANITLVPTTEIARNLANTTTSGGNERLLVSNSRNELDIERELRVVAQDFWSSLDTRRSPEAQLAVASAGGERNIDHRGSTAANHWSPFIEAPEETTDSAKHEGHNSSVDQDKVHGLVEELDRLADEHLDANDKLNLSYYLNEFETNSCDLSELLATLMQNLLTKLPNPMIKYKLLSLIKQIYIESSMQINPTTTTTRSSCADQGARVAREKHQLDLRLYEAMTQRYLVASNALICNAAQPMSAEMQRKRRRQRRAAELKLFSSIADNNNNKGEHSPVRNLDAATRMQSAPTTTAWQPPANGSLVYHSDPMLALTTSNGDGNGNEEGGVQVCDETTAAALAGRAVTKPTNGYRISKQHHHQQQHRANNSKPNSTNSCTSDSSSDSIRLGTSCAAGSGSCGRAAAIFCGSRMDPADEQFAFADSAPVSYRHCTSDTSQFSLAHRRQQQIHLTCTSLPSLDSSSSPPPPLSLRLPISDQQELDYAAPTYASHPAAISQMPHHTSCRSPLSPSPPLSSTTTMTAATMAAPTYNYNYCDPAHNEDEAYCVQFGRRVSGDGCCCSSLDKSWRAPESEFTCYDASKVGAGDLVAASGQVHGANALRASCCDNEIRSARHWQQQRRTQVANGLPIEAYCQTTNDGGRLFAAPTADESRVALFDEANDELSTCAARPLAYNRRHNGGDAMLSPRQFKFHPPAELTSNLSETASGCCYVNTAALSRSRTPLFDVSPQGRSGLALNRLAPMRTPQQRQFAATSDGGRISVQQPGGQQDHRRHRRHRAATDNSHRYQHEQQQQQQQRSHHQQTIQLRDYPAASRSQDNSGDEFADQLDTNSLYPSQVRARLPASVAQQMNEQANNFVHQFGPASKSSNQRRKPNLQVRRTLRVKIKKSKPILGIAIEGGFNVSGQLLPRIVCVHEDGAAYQCGKLRASDLILEVNGRSTVNMTHDEIAKTIANAYYQDPRSHIEFLIGESVHV